MNTTEILQGLKKPKLTPNGEQISLANVEWNAAIDSCIAALEKAMLEKAGEK